MVDPFRDQPPRLVQRRLRMMDSVKRRACPESLRIGIPEIPQFPVCGDDGALATAPDGADLSYHG
jgi:hypothetical protein